MTFADYLIAAPWWHWLFAVLIAALLSKWRPVQLEKSTHEHKHVHQGKD